LGTPPTSSAFETLRDDSKSSTQSAEAPAGPSITQDQRYVKLKPEFTKFLTWSNDPHDLDLYGAFSKDEPNLSSDFNVKGLRPSLKDPEIDQYILQDANGLYYLWDLWDGHLLRVTDKWTKGDDLIEVEDVVDNILCNLFWVEQDTVKVFRN